MAWDAGRAPELMDFSKESKRPDLYGVKKGNPFAGNCLLARRLAEREHFIQLYHSG